MKYVYPDKDENDLPIVVMSSDTVTFPVDGETAVGQAPAKPGGSAGTTTASACCSRATRAARRAN